MLLATVNLFTKYKTGRITVQKFKKQMLLWLVIFFVLILSFPVYNTLQGQPPLESASLSSFDIIEITAIVFLIYTVNNQRQKVESTEKRLRDLHQELSIKLSKTDGKD